MERCLKSVVISQSSNQTLTAGEFKFFKYYLYLRVTSSKYIFLSGVKIKFVIFVGKIIFSFISTTEVTLGISGHHGIVCYLFTVIKVYIDLKTIHFK